MYKKLMLGLATTVLLLGACSEKEKEPAKTVGETGSQVEEASDSANSTKDKSIQLEYELGLNKEETHKVFGDIFNYDTSKVASKEEFKDGVSELYQVDGLETRELVTVFNDKDELMFTSYMDVVGTEDGDTEETREEAELRVEAKFQDYVKAINGSFDKDKLKTKEIEEKFFVTYYEGDNQTFIYNKEAYTETIDIFSFTFYSNDDTVLEQLKLKEPSTDANKDEEAGTEEEASEPQTQAPTTTTEEEK